MKQTFSKRSIIKYGAAFITPMTVFIILQNCSFSEPSINEALIEAASNMNKRCPIMVDSVTRLDNLTALPGKTLQYNYTLISNEKSEIDTSKFKTELLPYVLNVVKTSPEMKLLRDNKVTFTYNYRDKKGVYIFKLPITPDMYKNEK